MNFFKPKKKRQPPTDDCQELSAIGDDMEAWDDLEDEQLKQVISVKFIEYGATQDGSWIFEIWPNPEAFRGMVG
ncbi:MAG: hypothetical protein WEB53_07565 [Akkermansiaceae bacterium]